MDAIAPARLRTVTQLIDHAATRLDDVAMLLDKPKAAGGRREAGLVITGAMHEARLAMERVGAAGVPADDALAMLATADETILERLPRWISSGTEMDFPSGGINQRVRAGDAVGAASKAVRELGTSRTLDAAIAAAPDAAPLNRDDALDALEALARSDKTDSSGRIKPMPLEARVLLERVMRTDLLLTSRAERALANMHGQVAGLAPDGEGMLRIETSIRPTMHELRAAIRTDRAAGAAIRDARESIDELVTEHVRIMRDGIDLALPPSTSELVEMAAAHSASTADHTAQLVDSGRYRLLSRRLQRWEDSGKSIRHAYDAAVSATRAQLVASRLPSTADEYVGQLQSEVGDLASHAYDNMLRVKDAAARGPIRRTIGATRIKPETLERTDLHETIANRAAQIQARHGEPLHRLETYREVFEGLGQIDAGVAT